tara:strand:+ start:2649 stop:2888 length:240 start_codon:yes stop_codon:yes gene_type:complete
MNKGIYIMKMNLHEKRKWVKADPDEYVVTPDKTWFWRRSNVVVVKWAECVHPDPYETWTYPSWKQAQKGMSDFLDLYNE